MKFSDIDPVEYASYYQTYLSKVPEWSLLEGLQESYLQTISFLKEIPDKKLNYKYQEGKWTIKEILQHLIDTERIMSYRALRIARFDKTKLPGYNENEYAKKADVEHIHFKNLMNDYTNVRNSTISLFKSFNNEMLTQIGIASDLDISVRAIAFIIMGHEIHHLEVIKNRYL